MTWRDGWQVLRHDGAWVYPDDSYESWNVPPATLDIRRPKPLPEPLISIPKVSSSNPFIRKITKQTLAWAVGEEPMRGVVRKHGPLGVLAVEVED